MIRHNLPALLVIVPLLAGLVTPFTRRGKLAWAWVTLVSWVVLAIAVGLLQQVLAPPAAIRYPMGSWKVPWAIEYRVDALNAFVILIVASVGAVITFAARANVEREIPPDRQHIFWAVWILCLTGLLGITVTGDAFNVYVLLEIASLSMYALIAMGKDRDRRALTATINYVVLGSIGACFILLGIGYLYMVTGTLNMVDMAERLQALQARWAAGDMAYRRTVLAGYGFFMAGFAIKLALFPLHGWMPNAYTYAPSPVSALLAATATKVGAYIAFRFMFTILGGPFCFTTMRSGEVLVVCGVLGALAGSYFAIRQTNVKRLLAYSSVGQIGYIAIGLGLGNATALQGSLIHLFNHAVMKGGLFLAVAAVVLQTGGSDLKNLRGIGRRMPLTAAAILLGGLAIVGMPLTAGFVSKWYLVSGAIKQGAFIPAAAVIVGSLLAVVYVWRIVETVYMQAPEPGTEVREAPLSVVIPAWILVGASLYFGINANLTSSLSEAAVRALGVLR
jgi:multicomponent Na+:H+ antiporter subunit D